MRARVWVGSSTGGGLGSRERARDGMGWDGVGCSGGGRDSKIGERGDVWWTCVGLQMRKMRMMMMIKGSRVEGGGRAGRGCGLGLMDPCAVNLQMWNLSLSRTYSDCLHTRYTLSLTLQEHQEHLPRLGCMCIVMAQTLRLSPVHRER
jgi:hypothetical protein